VFRPKNLFYSGPDFSNPEPEHGNGSLDPYPKFWIWVLHAQMAEKHEKLEKENRKIEYYQLTLKKLFHVSTRRLRIKVIPKINRRVFISVAYPDPYIFNQK
jgi:hypothetical protein